MLKRILRRLAFSTGRCSSLYLRVCRPSSSEYAQFLKVHGRLYGLGEDCAINLDVRILNPEYTRIGNNVCLSTCTLVGHDASVSVLNKAYDKKLDSVGKIDIKDNVFVGINATILPGVTIGSNSIVAAGAVVTKDVPSGRIVAGVPARVVGETLDLVRKLEGETAALPWKDLIFSREGAYDAALEPELISMRKKYFFENSQ